MDLYRVTVYRGHEAEYTAERETNVTVNATELYVPGGLYHINITAESNGLNSTTRTASDNIGECQGFLSEKQANKHRIYS